MPVAKSVYHPGEMKIQELAGVREQAENIAHIVHTSIPQIAREFLLTQRWVIVSSRTVDGHMSCSLLSGAPGFIWAPDEHMVRIDTSLPPDDPLTGNLRSGGDIGLLAIEFSTRRRMKVKGNIELSSGAILILAHQVFAICHKYIQQREVIEDEPGLPSTSHRAAFLGKEQQEWIQNADTFFIATYHPTIGPNAGYRGGSPGFVHIIDNRTLLFPDYPGNNMYNTLGNLVLDSHAGLLFLDFARGNTLQLEGRAQVISDPEPVARFEQARFLVEFKIHEVIQIDNATALRWRLLSYSSYNPTP